MLLRRAFLSQGARKDTPLVLSLISGRPRRRMLLVVTLFTAILLHEVDVGHYPIIAAHVMSGALLPVIFLPLALLALIAVQVRPNRAAELTLLGFSLVNLGVGTIGFLFHMNANGVTFAHLDKLFTFSLWNSSIGPNWPLSISFAGLFAIIAAYGAASDRAYVDSAPAGWARAGRDLAFFGIIVAIVLTFWDSTYGAARVVNVAAALLLALLAGTDIARGIKAKPSSNEEALVA